MYQGVNIVGVRKNAGSNGMDVVTIETGHVFVAKTPEVYTYDDDGNLTQDGRFAYEWDAENRLIAVETATNKVGAAVPAVRLEFAYDYMSRRVGKTVSQWTGSAWSLVSSNTFLYDGWNLVCELSNPATGNPTTNYYVWGQDISDSLQGAGGIGGLLSCTRGPPESATYVFLYDANGNVSELLDSSSPTTPAAHYEYSPFGETIVSTGSAADENPFRFSTKYWDDETGLGYWGYRYYSAGMGRWVSRDPIEEEGGVGVYTALQNDPVGVVDARGRNIVVNLARYLLGQISGVGLFARQLADVIGGIATPSAGNESLYRVECGDYISGSVLPMYSGGWFYTCRYNCRLTIDGIPNDPGPTGTDGGVVYRAEGSWSVPDDVPHCVEPRCQVAVDKVFAAIGRQPVLPVGTVGPLLPASEW